MDTNPLPERAYQDGCNVILTGRMTTLKEFARIVQATVLKANQIKYHGYI
jgi:hypothetical protein